MCTLEILFTFKHEFQMSNKSNTKVKKFVKDEELVLINIHTRMYKFYEHYFMKPCTFKKNLCSNKKIHKTLIVITYTVRVNFE